MPGGIYDAPGNFAPGKATRAQLSSTDKMLAMMAEEVAELHPQALRRLMPVLQDARKELRAGLLKWLAEAPDGSNRFTAQAMRNTLLNLEGALDKMRELEPAMAEALIDGSKVAGELSVKHLRQEVARMSTVFGESLFNSPQLRVADVITDSEKILIPRHRNSANRYAGNMLTDIKRQLGVGVARGETYFQLQQRLRRLGGPKGLVAVRGTKGDPRAIVEDISEGLFNRYRHWAQRVVRTEMSNSYNHHHEMGVRDLNDQIGDDEDVYMLRWDARNDGLCAICQALDRTAVKVGEQFAPGIYRAPAHPNCLCRVGAWRKDWGDMDGEVALKGKAPGPHATNWPPQASDELKERLRRKPKFRKAPLPMPTVKAEPAPPKKSAPKPNKRKAPRPAPKPEVTPKPQPQKLPGHDAIGRGKYSEARVEMDRDFESRGFKRTQERLGVDSGKVALESSRKWLGAHNLATGGIRLTPSTAKGAKKFAASYSKDPSGVLAAIGRADQALEDLVPLRKELAKDRARLRMASGARKTQLAEEFNAKVDDYNATRKAIQQTPDFKVKRDSIGMHTIVHEVFHGYGPGLTRSIKGSGLVVEEITTEILARAEMTKTYGTTMGNSGGYSVWVDGVTDAIEAIYSVDKSEATKMFVTAAEKYKKSPRLAKNPAQAVTEFAVTFPGDETSKLISAIHRVAARKP